MTDERQLQIDPWTGLPTAITGDNCSSRVRETCTSLNRERARGIIEAGQPTAPGESSQVDVWVAAYSERAERRRVPLVDLGNLGLSFDPDGFISSEFLRPLTSGAEAHPYLDVEGEVVYKLFDLRPGGYLGKKLVFNFNPDGFEVDVADATLSHTVQKLSALSTGGGLPTEIVGIATSGNFLVAKQPMAYPLVDYVEDRSIAEHRFRAVTPVGGGLRQRAIVSRIEEEFWMIGDLHERNIMRDADNEPVIIDALVGWVSPEVRSRLQWLDQACTDAEVFRLTDSPPKDRFGNFNDEEL